MDSVEMEIFSKYAEELIVTCCEDCPWSVPVMHCKMCTGYHACTHPENTGVEYPGTLCPDECPLKVKTFDIRNILTYQVWVKKTKGKLPFHAYQTQKLWLQQNLCFHALNPNIKTV